MTYLKDSYQKFLANPRSAPLAPNVSLIYVTSTTKIEGAEAVATHVSRQAAIVKKKSEQVISAIESSDSLCLDVETTLEFLEGGGAYLPSLDDNFLADRVVTFPTVNSPRSHTPDWLKSTVAVFLTRICYRFTSSTSTPTTRSNRCASTGTRVRC